MKTLIALLLLALPLTAGAQDWKVDPAHSTLGFTGSFQGETFHGTFKTFDAKIRFDPAHLEQARFDVTVQLASVDTKSPERNQTLTGPDFFDTASDSTAHFTTKSFDKTAGGIVAHGMLDLNGMKQPVTLKVDFKRNGDHATLDVDTTLNRLNFKLGTGSDWSAISKQIPVHGHLEMTSLPAH
jgi:polyisoprenoid-binding protein YceI